MRLPESADDRGERQLLRQEQKKEARHHGPREVEEEIPPESRHMKDDMVIDFTVRLYISVLVPSRLM